MAIDKFTYIFKKFVKSPIALMTRNQISIRPMWKSDFQMGHGFQIWKFPYLKTGSFGNPIFLHELLVAMAMEKFPYIFKKFVKSS